MFDSDKEYCPNCDPYRYDKNHYHEKIGMQFVAPIIRFLEPFGSMVGNYKIFSDLNKVVLKRLFDTLILLNILRETEIQDNDENVYNRSLVIFREAKKRGLDVKLITIFGMATHHFSIKINGERNYFESLPIIDTKKTLSIDFDDKGKLKEVLRKEKLPYPQGSVLKDYPSAITYIEECIGFPVVVKPKSGSLSKHVTCNIKDAKQLRKAVTIVKMVSDEFVVEEHIQGKVHRITVVNKNFFASCWREPPNVVGDGKRTIQELVEEKNRDPFRGSTHQKNTTLHYIVLSNKTIEILASQNLDPESVLSEGEKIYLNNKVVLAAGADIHDNSDDLHEDNKELFRKIYELCGAPFIGIDFIADDISKPYYQQKTAVIEVNSVPYIDMHHYPTTGHGRDVAGAILDQYLSHKNSVWTVDCTR